ncbi:hypothetical protein [Hymenobacter negativus]|uniref:Uncharacterized protein n=1 Tax=Hymenobacter negativus TaxID=2795026 RepID=A0ABS3Q973_9BACT|nr:hypothetical protein [Hymenobacter negativus]MBO2007563.1 hypothetical protein [Hymenobacter negativus]
MFVALPLEFIEVPVSDRVFQETTVKQKARWVTLSVAQDPATKHLLVLVGLTVELYATHAGEYGSRLLGRGFADYPVTLRADNECAVYFNPADEEDPRNGQILYLQGERDAAEWAQLLEQAPEPVALQGDAFRWMMHHQPLVIGRMVRDFIAQADQDPRFSKFA